MAVSDLDIRRSAALLIKEHGAAAWMVAAARFRELNAAGDAAGAEVWDRIQKLIAVCEDMNASIEVH